MKKIIFVVMSLFAVLLIYGCTTHSAIVLNESLPKEETVTIYWITAGVHPVVYNGISVDWQLKKTGWNTIIIPAGVVTFELQGTQYDTTYIGNVRHSTAYTWDGISFSYNFEKGREYTVSPLFSTIRIYNGKSYAMSDKDLIEVIRPKWE